ncbi:MAG: OmpA family protein, partial [Streptosporangiaceae bacterium]
ATALNTQLGTVSTKLQGVDQFQTAQTAELHFKPGPATLNPNAQQQLDGFLQGLDTQKGYVVEVTAYSSRKGAAGDAASQQLADTVVRYMVLQHNIPLFRIYTMGLGNAPAAAQLNSANGTPVNGGTVQIKILKNSLASGS